MVGSSRISRVGLVKERLHQADLLAVAAAQTAHRHIEVQAETIGQVGSHAQVGEPADAGEVGQLLARGHAGIQAEIAR